LKYVRMHAEGFHNALGAMIADIIVDQSPIVCSIGRETPTFSEETALDYVRNCRHSNIIGTPSDKLINTVRSTN
jgi:hypothetical protein